MTHPTETAVEALRELVACEDLGDSIFARADYARRHPLAWEAARRVLATERAPETDARRTVLRAAAAWAVKIAKEAAHRHSVIGLEAGEEEGAFVRALDAALASPATAPAGEPMRKRSEELTRAIELTVQAAKRGEGAAARRALAHPTSQEKS